jgi:hypothetical protein
MAPRRTYLAWLVPVALFLAAMVSADGGSDGRPLAEPLTRGPAVETHTRSVAIRQSERVQMVLDTASCSDTQRCYDLQLKRLQAASLY